MEILSLFTFHVGNDAENADRIAKSSHKNGIYFI